MYVSYLQQHPPPHTPAGLVLSEGSIQFCIGHKNKIFYV